MPECPLIITYYYTPTRRQEASQSVNSDNSPKKRGEPSSSSRSNIHTPTHTTHIMNNSDDDIFACLLQHSQIRLISSEHHVNTTHNMPNIGSIGSFAALLACILLIRVQSFARSALRWKTPLRMASDGSGEQVSRLWLDRVEYIDLSSSLEPSPTSRNLPLFLLGGAFYPQGVTYLNVFEMKYRTMMFDIANTDDVFGYIHTDSSGRIATVGTMCKITDRQLLDDGRQLISMEGVSRFRVRKIVKTLPYVVAEVEPELQDTIPENEGVATKLEFEVYDALKYYMRLMKCYEPNKTLVISQAAKQSRPNAPSLDPHKRRTDFSFALANMIQMTQAKESQLILQTTSVVNRLEAEKGILLQATELITEQLMKLGVLTAAMRDTIKSITLNSDDDSDILPPDSSLEEDKDEKDEWDISNIE